jgi:hypothetical protein
LVSTAIITMAGAGQRFRDAKYDRPKFEIVVRGQTLFTWAMESLRSFIEGGSPFIFVARRIDRASPFIAAEATRLGIASHRVIELDSITDGQATTALMATPSVDNVDAPVFIYNIDTHVDPCALPIAAIRGHGWVPCFPGEGDAWSFARADESGKVSELREKVRISPHASVGLYWFSSFALYRDTYLSYFGQSGRLEQGERYIAPMYNGLIARGLDVYIHEVPARAVIPLGTPTDVERFSRAT